jgi:hypothetical protein
MCSGEVGLTLLHMLPLPLCESTLNLVLFLCCQRSQIGCLCIAVCYFLYSRLTQRVVPESYLDTYLRSKCTRTFESPLLDSTSPMENSYLSTTAKFNVRVNKNHLPFPFSCFSLSRTANQNCQILVVCARLLVSAEKTKSTCTFVNPAIKWSRPERNGERFNGRVKL